MNEHRLHGLKSQITQIVFLASVLCFLASVPVYAGLAVSVTGGNWAIGDIGIGATKQTSAGKWTVTNGGSGEPEAIYIKVDGSDASNPWHPGTSAGIDTFILKHNASGSWSDAVTNSGNGIVLKKGLASAGTASFDLQFTGPTSTTAASQRTMTVTLTAAQVSLVANEVCVLDTELICIGTATGYLIWPRPVSCVATNNNAAKQWKTANTSGQPTWSDATDSYTYPGVETSANYPAFAWAEGVDYKGYTDWRLPTKDELKQLYDYGRTYITYTSSYYWSATEYSATNAWYVYFTNGDVYYNNKTYAYYVRAVRSGQ